MMRELEQAQEQCVVEMADQWRKLRDTLHSNQPPQGLNEVSCTCEIHSAHTHTCSNILTSALTHSAQTHTSIHTQIDMCTPFTLPCVCTCSMQSVYVHSITLLHSQVFLVSSRQLASQYDKTNKAAQKKLHKYAAEVCTLKILSFFLQSCGKICGVLPVVEQLNAFQLP